jgi:hypothetical protein
MKEGQRARTLGRRATSQQARADAETHERVDDGREVPTLSKVFRDHCSFNDVLCESGESLRILVGRRPIGHLEVLAGRLHR